MFLVLAHLTEVALTLVVAGQQPEWRLGYREVDQLVVGLAEEVHCEVVLEVAAQLWAEEPSPAPAGRTASAVGIAEVRTVRVAPGTGLAPRVFGTVQGLAQETAACQELVHIGLSAPLSKLMAAAGKARHLAESEELKGLGGWNRPIVPTEACMRSTVLAAVEGS